MKEVLLQEEMDFILIMDGVSPFLQMMDPILTSISDIWW
jgi:hypothetical protein